MTPKNHVHYVTDVYKILHNWNIIFVTRNQCNFVDTPCDDSRICILRDLMCDSNIYLFLPSCSVSFVRRHLEAVRRDHFPKGIPRWWRAPQIGCANLVRLATGNIMQSTIVKSPCGIENTTLDCVIDIRRKSFFTAETR